MEYMTKRFERFRFSCTYKLHHVQLPRGTGYTAYLPLLFLGEVIGKQKTGDSGGCDATKVLNVLESRKVTRHLNGMLKGHLRNVTNVTWNTFRSPDQSVNVVCLRRTLSSSMLTLLPETQRWTSLYKFSSQLENATLPTLCSSTLLRTRGLRTDFRRSLDATISRDWFLQSAVDP